MIKDNFNNIKYTSSVTKFSDYISDKYDDVHNQLYNNALKSYIESLGLENVEEYKQTHIFSEIKNREYWMPSKVMIKSIVEPYTIKTVDLSKYWDVYEYKVKFKKMKDDYLKDKEDINAFVIIYIDYVNGKIKLKNKNNGKIIWKDIEYLNSKLKIDKDELSLNNTFSYKLQNKIYGK